MRIERLDIEGFGHFANQSFGPLEAGVTVMFGPNEAGKTTLLAFIRTVLFGFPARNRDQHYPPGGGSRHGGRLTLRDERDEQYVVERYAGARGGSLSIRTGGAQVEGDEDMLQRLLGHADKNLFQNVFAFGLDELQSFESLKGKEASDHIYAAGTGARRLPSAVDSLEKRAANLFKHGGSTQAAAQILSSLLEIDGKLETARGHAAQYGGLRTRRTEIAEELERAVGRSEGLQAQQREVERVLQAWEDWTRLQDLDRELGELPATTGFPQDGLARLDQLEGAARSAREEQAIATAALQRATAAVEAETEDEALVADAEAVEAIRRGIQSYEDSRRDLPRRESDAAAERDKLAAALRELGPGWDEPRVERFDTSATARAGIEHWRQQLANLDSDVREANREEQQAEEVLSERRSEAKRSEGALETGIDPMTSEEIERGRAALRATRSALDAFLRAQARRGDLESGLKDLGPQPAAAAAAARSGAKFLGPALTLVGAAAAGWGVVAGGTPGTAGMVAGAAAVFAGLYVWFRPGARPSQIAALDPGAGLRRRVEQAAAEEAQAREAVTGAASRLVPPLAEGPLPTGEALDELAARLDREENARRERSRLESARAEALDAMERQVERVQRASSKAEAAQTAVDAARAGWRSTLEGHGLRPDLLPDTVLHMLGDIVTTRETVARLREHRDRAEKISANIAAYEAAVSELAAGHKEHVAEGEAALAANRLARRLDAARTALTRRANELERLAQAQAELESREVRANSLEDDIETLVQAGGVDSIEEFRTKAAHAERRAEAEKERRDVESRLRRAAGSPESFAPFLVRLRGADADQLGQERGQLAQELQEAGSRHTELNREDSALTTQLEQLTGDEEASELRVRRAGMVDELRAVAREWSKLRIAGVLLDQARQKYERERQPGVIRHAQEFFATVTGGRYEQILAPLGEQTLSAIAGGGATKAPGQLSRGTQEQLYLALRFGLIRQFAERATVLPVVVDDILVNFDPERARRAAAAFAELAKTHQVLVFTCHPAVVELFTGEAPGTEVIELGQGSGAG